MPASNALVQFFPRKVAEPVRRINRTYGRTAIRFASDRSSYCRRIMTAQPRFSSPSFYADEGSAPEAHAQQH
jgi:hypothetical protein